MAKRMVKVKPPKKVKKETISKVQYRLTDISTALVLDETIADKPDLEQLHSIIKFNLKLIEATTGFDMVQILTEIWKSIKDDVKIQHKCLIDDWSNYGIRDNFKIQVKNFHRYK